MSEGLSRDPQIRPASTSTRIDAAHVPSDTPEAADRVHEPPKEMIDAIVGSDAQHIGEQMRRQTSELATHLLTQRRRLDQRESECNSRMAQLEQELRTARLLIREHQRRMSDRRLESHELVVGSAAGQSADKQSPAHGVQGRQNELLQDWQRRRQVLEQSETALLAQQRELEAYRQRLQQERRVLEDRCRSDRQQLCDEKQATDAEIDQKRNSLDRWRRSLEKRQVALKQLYGEIMRMHRESLEMRVCTEQLWAELCGAAPEPQLTRKLDELRGKLADHYRLANQSLAEQKDEITELLGRLGEQQKKIQDQRSELEFCVKRRQTEIEQEAARLAARGQELDARETDVYRLREQWESQRREYQEEIRRLMAKLRDATLVHLA
jgi:chromosome segregation ATPase